MMHVIFDTQNGRIIRAGTDAPEPYLREGLDVLSFEDMPVTALFNKQIDVRNRVLIDSPQQVEDREAVLRRVRNALLLSTDWTLGPDSPLSEQQKADAREYRQGLRDATQTGIIPPPPSWMTF